METSIETINKNISSSFKPEAVKEVLKLKWTDDKTRINDEALDLMLEVTRKLCLETALRAAYQAQAQNDTVVQIQHVEKIIPQILLDF